MCATDLSPTILLQQQEIARLNAAINMTTRVFARFIDAVTLLQVRYEAELAQTRTMLADYPIPSDDESMLADIARLTTDFRKFPTDGALQSVENLVQAHAELKAEVVGLRTKLAMVTA